MVAATHVLLKDPCAKWLEDHTESYTAYNVFPSSGILTSMALGVSVYSFLL